MRAYLAAPLFNSSERDFNEMLCRHLEGYLEVFLPQRDGELLTELVHGGMPVKAAQVRVFSRDVSAIVTTDLLVAVLDGRTVDEGVAFELGFGRAFGKICIGFKSDDRHMLPTGDNPMIVCGCHYVCSSIGDLMRVICDLNEIHASSNLRQDVSPYETPLAP